MRHLRNRAYRPPRNGQRGPMQGFLSLVLVFTLPLVVMTCFFVLASFVLQWFGVTP